MQKFFHKTIRKSYLRKTHKTLGRLRNLQSLPKGLLEIRLRTRTRIRPNCPLSCLSVERFVPPSRTGLRPSSNSWPPVVSPFPSPLLTDLRGRRDLSSEADDAPTPWCPVSRLPLVPPPTTTTGPLSTGQYPYLSPCTLFYGSSVKTELNHHPLKRKSVLE